MTKLGDLEAVLFASGRPLTEDELARLLGVNEKEIAKLADRLREELEKMGSCLRVVTSEDTYALRLKDDYLEIAEKVTKPTMDRDLLKTASLIGYYQPILQSDLKNMVGSKAYEHVSQLMEMGLIAREKEGRSFALRTTKEFSTYFGIESSDPKKVKEWLSSRMQE